MRHTRFNSLQTGKAFRTIRNLEKKTRDLSLVSIPFKRERLSEREKFVETKEKVALEFQFPSNGKGFPNGLGDYISAGKILVSIPFKRERLSELKVYPFLATAGGVFQFPSNGKGFPNVGDGINHRLVQLFQFPSNGKGFPNRDVAKDLVISLVFQFPSNGKGFPNGWYFTVSFADPVFQFPSNGKGFPNLLTCRIN